MRDQAILRQDRWHFYLDGKEVSQKKYEKRYPPPEEPKPGDVFMCPMPGAWPRVSEALAVHPGSVKEAAADAERRGVQTDFDPHTGGPIFRDKDHQTRYSKAYGFWDRDGGYRDAPKPELRDTDPLDFRHLDDA